MNKVEIIHTSIVNTVGQYQAYTEVFVNELLTNRLDLYHIDLEDKNSLMRLQMFFDYNEFSVETELEFCEIVTVDVRNKVVTNYNGNTIEPIFKLSEVDIIISKIYL